MKKSELLIAAKQLLQTPEQVVAGIKPRGVTVYVCNAIGLAASQQADAAAMHTAAELVRFIQGSIHKQAPDWNVVTAWLYHNPAVGCHTTAEEAQEYRHLWVDDMIAYWQSKGE